MQMDFNEINELLFRLLDNDISDADFARLKDWLGSGSEAKLYYYRFMSDFGVLSLRKMTKIADDLQESHFEFTETGAIDAKPVDESNVSIRGVDLDEFMADVDADDDDDNEMTQDMLELLEIERTSPAVEIEKPKPVKPKRELIQKVENNFKWFPGEGNKPLLVAALTIAACFMVFIGYLHFNPAPLPLPIVAELVDVIDAEWDGDMQLPDDSGQMRKSTYRLKKGYASILFNSGAKVTVEAPAEISLNSAGDMKLFSGKIYATVPPRAKGFTVKTASSKIVDLGTEFGVEVDTNNNTQLHVTKGETLLYSGSKDSGRTKNNVDAGQAKKIYNDGFVKDIDVAKRKFVRHINSKTGFVFKGWINEVIYEPFDYAGSGLNGQSGDTEIGLGGVWNARIPSPAAFQGFLMAKNLTYGRLPTTGGSLKTDYAYWANRFGGTRPIDPAAMAGNGLLDNGATLWFSALIGLGVHPPGADRGDNSSNSHLAFALASDSFVTSVKSPDNLKAGTGVGIYLHKMLPYAASYTSSGVTRASESGPKYDVGVHNLVVCKITWGATPEADDTIELYLPDKDLVLPAEPVSTLTAKVDQSTFDTLTFRIGDVVLIDEIRFGKSYSDVLGGR